MPELGDGTDRTSSQPASKDSLQPDTSLDSTSVTSSFSSDSLGARYKLGTTNPHQRAFRDKNSIGSGGTDSASTAMEVDQRVEDGGRDGGKTANAEHMLPTSDGIALSQHVTGNDDDDERTAAHTSTKVKSLTPFCLRSRRDDATSLLADDARRSCGSLNTPFNLDTSTSSSSSSFKEASMPNLSNYHQHDKRYPAETGVIQDGPALTSQMAGLRRGVASVDDIRPPSVTALLEPGTVPSEVTSTVQTTSTRASPAVPLAAETGVASTDSVTPAGDKRHSSTENLVTDRASPRPRMNIYADIRQRVFGRKQPATDLQQVLNRSEAKERGTEKLTSTEPPVSVRSSTPSVPALSTAPVVSTTAHQLTSRDTVTQRVSHSPSTTQNLPGQSFSTPLTQTSSPNLATSATVRPSSLFTISASSRSPPGVTSATSVANTSVVQAPATSFGSSQTQTSTSTGSQTLAAKLGINKHTSAAQSQNEAQPATSGRVTRTEPLKRPLATAEVSPWTKSDDMMNYPGTQYNLRQKPESKSDVQIENLVPQSNQTRSTQDLPRGIATVQQGNNLQTSASNAAVAEQHQQQQLRASTRPEESLRTTPVSSTAAAQPATTTPFSDAATAPRGKIIPSSVSRVDWAKQRFGSSQPLDSNFGFVAASTDYSPKKKKVPTATLR